jgi:DNA-binding NarL/FixJ family response regulator
MSIIKLVFADDHQGFRTTVSDFLRRDGHINVIAEAENGNEALKFVRELSPDILLLDMRMPQLDGVGVSSSLRSENNNIKVLAFSVYDDDEYVRGMYENGAAGYLLKGESPDTLLSVLTRIFQGEKSFFSHKIADKLRGWGYDFENRFAYA